MNELFSKRESSGKGFTLLELIVVIVILALLAALAIPTFKRIIGQSQLKVAEVTAGAVARNTLALSGLDADVISEQHILTSVSELPGGLNNTEVSASSVLPGYQVVFGKWEFSGNERTLSAVRGGTPVGSSMGVALTVPGVGCAFALTTGNTVKTWNVMGLNPLYCSGAGAYMPPDDISALTPPPMPGGFNASFGCVNDEDGWLIDFDSPAFVKVFINGVFIGEIASGSCVPGGKDDVVTVVPSDFENPLGDTLGGGEVIPDVPSEGVSTPVVSDGTKQIGVTWERDRGEVTIWRAPVDDPTKWVPVYTGRDPYFYEVVPQGQYIYKNTPHDPSSGTFIPIEIVTVTNPNTVRNDHKISLVGNTVVLSWGEVQETVSAPLTGYNIYRSVNGSSYSLLTTVEKGMSSYMDEKLVSGEYCYRLSAYGLGGESPQTTPTCVTIMPRVGDEKPSSKLVGESELFSRFGTAVSVDGDTLVAGITPGTSKTGYVIVYERSGNDWVQKTKLTASDTVVGNAFGKGVIVSGDTIFVNSNRGVYVFSNVNDSWVEKQIITLTPTDMAYDSGKLLLGSVGGGIKIGTSVASGAAYIFEKQNGSWVQVKELLPPTPVSGERFGVSVDIDKGTVVIGAESSKRGTSSVLGSVYVFESLNNWVSPVQFFADDAANNQKFGSVVAVSGSNIAVTASADASKGNLAGAVYTFHKEGSTWLQTSKLFGEDTVSRDVFGASLVLKGDALFVGATGNNKSGAVYSFTNIEGPWQQVSKLVPDEIAGSAAFGSSLSINDKDFIIGAPGENSRGAVYPYNR